MTIKAENARESVAVPGIPAEEENLTRPMSFTGKMAAGERRKTDAATNIHAHFTRTSSQTLRTIVYICTLNLETNLIFLFVGLYAVWYRILQFPRKRFLSLSRYMDKLS